MEEKNKSLLKGVLLGAGSVLLLAAVAVVSAIMLVGLFRTVRGKEPAESRNESEGTAEQKETRDPVEASRQAEFARFEEVMGLLDANFVLDYDSEEMFTAALKAYVAATGDPYSAYLTAEEYADMMESSDGSYCGIGVMVSQNIETLETEVIQVFSASSAREEGLQVGDIIVSVDGRDVRELDVDTMVTYIRGAAGTKVAIGVYRPLDGRNYEFTIERRVVEVDTVVSRMLTDKVGYIQLVEFDNVSVGQVKNAIRELKAQGMEDLVFDIRNNPGGLLNSVLDIVDLFLPKGLKTFSMQSKNGKMYEYYSQTAASFGGKMAVLINGNSASAAEVFAGNMKDHKRAVLLGEESFGKGIVQGFYELSDGSALKLTTEYYFTPSGKCIHKLGIDPDIEGTDDPATADVDELLELALKQLEK